MGCNHLKIRKEGDQNENDFINKWCTTNFTMALQMIQCSVDISLSLNGSKLLCLSIDVPQHNSSLSILVTQLVTQGKYNISLSHFIELHVPLLQIDTMEISSEEHACLRHAWL